MLAVSRFFLLTDIVNANVISFGLLLAPFLCMNLSETCALRILYRIFFTISLALLHFLPIVHQTLCIYFQYRFWWKEYEEFPSR